MFFFFRPEDDPDTKKLGALLAADDVLGAKHWTWEMLAEWGLQLNPAEAETRIERGYLDNPIRGELYNTLFQFHPELLATLNPQVDDGRPHHFIVQLSEPEGWPHPEKELERLAELAGEYERRTIWFGCSRNLKNWRPAAKGRSRAVLFFRHSGGGITAYSGEILGRQPTRPFARYLDELYPESDNSKVKSWVLLGRFTRLGVKTLDEIPGTSQPGLPASESFLGINTFSFWQFRDADLAKLALRVK